MFLTKIRFQNCRKRVIHLQESVKIKKIRNFCIIAHVDHGKSTLADCFLKRLGVIEMNSKPQFLDQLEVERTRGITVKAQTCSMLYSTDKEKYLLNLIDTPGHVDFSYEVSRSLAASDGVILLGDATQVIQAQTTTTFYTAYCQNLK